VPTGPADVAADWTSQGAPVAVPVLLSANGANAPADDPEHADTLPVRALRRDPRPRRRLAELSADGASADANSESGPAADARGTPGTSHTDSAADGSAGDSAFAGDSAPTSESALAGDSRPAGESAPGDDARDTPGMSQPESVIAASLRPRDLPFL
jgi:hypothetical protein